MKRVSGAHRRFLIWAAALLLLCLLLEGVLFQYDALHTRGLKPLPLRLTDAERTVEELPRTANDVQAVMPSVANAGPLYRTEITFSGLELTGIETVSLTLAGKNRLVPVQVLLSDDAYQYGFARADSSPVLPGQAECLRLTSHGALHALRVTFETEDETAELAEIVLNVPIAYRFSLLRFAALLLPCEGIAAVCCFALWRVVLDRKRAAHRLAYGLTALCCALLVLAVQVLCSPADRTEFPYTRALEYPFEKSVYQYRSLAHAVLYDMLAKGRVSVDAEPAEALLALDNPYDPTARLESGAEVLFDYALYDGHYYAYFGLAPVLVFSAPFRLVTGHLPAYTTAACFFALLTVAAAFLCVWEALRRFVRRPSLLLACLGAAAAALGSNLLMLQASADRYHLSIACMQTFFYLTLYTGLAACRQKKAGKRAALFALCAVCTGLLVTSRATGAIAAAGWIVPLFVLVLADRERAPRGKRKDAAAYLLPLLLCAAGVMAYNAARFGSPFEFGQSWQLTLEDIHYNQISLRDVPAALYCYFLDGLRLSPEFPWVTLGESFVNHTGNWFYGVGNAGALTLPVTWGLALLPALPEKGRRGKLAVYLCAVGITLPLAVMSFAVAGAAQRYVCDLLPSLCLAGMLALTELGSRDAGEGRARTSAAACALFALTVIIACSLAFGNYRNFISQYAPDKYLALYRLFTIR